MNANTLQFAEKEIINLKINASDNQEATSELNFNLIFCSDFDDLPDDLGNPNDFIMNNKDTIVAVYKYVAVTKASSFFVDFEDSKTTLFMIIFI